MNDDTPGTPETADDSTHGTRFPKWLTWGLLGALGVLVIGYGLIFLYAKVINDSPDELGTSDLDAALAADDTTATTATPATPATPDSTTAPTAAPDETTAPAVTASPSTTGATAVDAPAGAQEWVVTDASQLGYRVKEVLFGVDTEAVGRTNQITGSFLIDGQAVTSGSFVVDVASISSDESRRDGQFRGRIMSTDEFPEAIFTLTEPIELGTDPVEGATVSTDATGELTLRGVTNPVTFALDGRVENGRIGVLGNIPIVFEDYGVPNPSTGGITTEDNGLLEFVLVFEPA
jgi:polyisoprenoid-binding protein YceI